MHACLQGPAGGASPELDGWDVGGSAHMNLEQVPTVELKPGFAAKIAATLNEHCTRISFLSCISKMCIDAV